MIIALSLINAFYETSFFRLWNLPSFHFGHLSYGGYYYLQGEAKLPPATPNTFNVHPTGLPWFLYNRLRICRWLSWFSFSLKTLRLPPFGLVNSGFFTACRKKHSIQFSNFLHPPVRTDCLFFILSQYPLLMSLLLSTLEV